MFSPASRLALASLILALAAPSTATSQQADARPWFSLAPPPGLGDPHGPPIPLHPGFSPEPAVVPSGEEVNTPALGGDRIRRDLETIVGFSVESRASGERMWGRVTGRPGAARAAEWTAERFREIGLQGVEIQTFPSSGEMWWPVEWEVRLLADPAFGAGSRDIVLESALPTSGAEIEGVLTAPLVFAGVVGGQRLADVDVRGRAAVQVVRPTSGVYGQRQATVAAARELLERGAVAVLNVVEQTGNMHVRDFSNCGPCFNLGAADGAFLLAVLERADATAAGDPEVRLRLRTERLSDLSARNVVGTVPGMEDGVVIVNAHVDGWFDAAGDNGDGLAVQLALARYFVDPENQPVRTLVFVASAGHHSPGMNGPSNFVRMNPEIAERAALVVNLEHVAQLELDPSTWQFRETEQPMSFGISNLSPYLVDIARRGMRRYGFRLNPEFSANVPGELGGYRSTGVPLVQAIHAGPLYHTSGDTLESISVPGLERAARFFAYFIREVARAPEGWIDP